jgi:hypothetical protein
LSIFYRGYFLLFTAFKSETSLFVANFLFYEE